MVQLGPHAIDRASFDASVIDGNPFWCPDPVAAADRVIASRTRRIDLAVCRGRYFVTVLAAGFDAIALAFEGIADLGRLRQALALATGNGKRVALCKVGTSEAGRAAVRHHTATDPGDPAQLDALRLLPGVVVVNHRRGAGAPTCAACRVRRYRGLAETGAGPAT